MKAKLIIELDIPERDEREEVTAEDILNHVEALFEDVLYGTEDIKEWSIQEVME